MGVGLWAGPSKTLGRTSIISEPHNGPCWGAPADTVRFDVGALVDRQDPTSHSGLDSNTPSAICPQHPARSIGPDNLIAELQTQCFFSVDRECAINLDVRVVRFLARLHATF